MPLARLKAWLVSISLMKKAPMEQQNHSTIRNLAKIRFNAHHFHHHHPHYHLRIPVLVVTNKMSKLSNHHLLHLHRRPTNNPMMISSTALLFQSPPYTFILFHQKQRVSNNNVKCILLILTCSLEQDLWFYFSQYGYVSGIDLHLNESYAIVRYVMRMTHR